jgi:hypothetical protein
VEVADTYLCGLFSGGLKYGSDRCKFTCSKVTTRNNGMLLLHVLEIFLALAEREFTTKKKNCFAMSACLHMINDSKIAKNVFTNFDI